MAPAVKNAPRLLNSARRTVRRPQDARVNPKAPPARTNSRISNSRAQNNELQRDIKSATQQRATDIRVNQQQVDASGRRVGINRPDLQYTRKDGTRVYTEYDKPGRGANSVFVDERMPRGFLRMMLRVSL